jgi:serine/threonine protein phosphatase PrpC
MRVAMRTNAGRVREINEDCAFVESEAGFAILADGMGGHLAGEVASTLAVEMLAGCMLHALKDQSPEEEQKPIGFMLSQSIDEANRTIFERASEDNDLKGMGTTIVAAVATGNTVHIAHVGDSRAYLMRAGVLRQVTRDHSLVQEMLACGQISEKEAGTHPMRNVLTRALGNESEVLVDVQELEWQDQDFLLLCTDGLTTMVEDSKIGKILGRYGNDLEAACDELIRAANSKGGKDNVTVVLACPA